MSISIVFTNYIWLVMLQSECSVVPEQFFYFIVWLAMKMQCYIVVMRAVMLLLLLLSLCDCEFNAMAASVISVVVVSVPEP